MARKATGSGPKFVSYFVPLVEALWDLGGSARPAEVRQAIAAKLGLSDETLTETMQSGLPRFDNQVAWARFYLAKAGIIDASSRGVWTLTEKGRQLDKFTRADALQLFKESMLASTGQKRMLTWVKTRKPLKLLQKMGQCRLPLLTGS